VRSLKHKKSHKIACVFSLAPLLREEGKHRVCGGSPHPKPWASTFPRKRGEVTGKNRLFEKLSHAHRDAHSAALPVLAPNMRVGEAKPQDVPSVILTWSSHGKRYVPATMSCMKV